MTRAHRSVLRLVVLTAALALVAAFAPADTSLSLGERGEAQATIGADLADYLEVAPDDERIEVIVSFHEADDTGLLDRLDAPYGSLQVLPMVGAYLTPDEIAEVASWPEVRGVHPNTELELFNHQSVPMSGAPDVWALGFTGEGVTIAVHDTGIDGTHPDLTFPDKTIQNIKIAHARFADMFHGVDHDAPTFTVEDQPHTDTTSGHGTHVAGTAAGEEQPDPAVRGMATRPPPHR
jgi:serine protease AprX